MEKIEKKYKIVPGVKYLNQNNQNVQKYDKFIEFMNFLQTIHFLETQKMKIEKQQEISLPESE